MLLCIVCVMMAFGVKAEAATIVQSGVDSNGISWELDSDGVITFTGEGDMYCYSLSNVPYLLLSGR